MKDKSPEPQGSGNTSSVSGESFLSPTVRLGIAVLLVVLLVAALVVGALSWNTVQQASAEQDARQEVASVAERFTLAVNDYDAGSVDSYQEAITPLLSTKFRGEFEQAMEDIVVSVREAEMNSQGELLASGVADVDENSARALVVADAAVETVFDSRQRHFRWEISLVKVDDAWLVDDFTPVA